MGTTHLLKTDKRLIDKREAKEKKCLDALEKLNDCYASVYVKDYYKDIGTFEQSMDALRRTGLAIVEIRKDKALKARCIEEAIQNLKDAILELEEGTQ